MPRVPEASLRRRVAIEHLRTAVEVLQRHDFPVQAESVQQVVTLMEHGSGASPRPPRTGPSRLPETPSSATMHRYHGGWFVKVSSGGLSQSIWAFTRRGGVAWARRTVRANERQRRQAADVHEIDLG